METLKRLEELKKQNLLTGIDFLKIEKELDGDGMAVIHVHFFLHKAELQKSLAAEISKENLQLHSWAPGEKRVQIPIDEVLNWEPEAPNKARKFTLTIKTRPPKNRSRYRLRIEHALVDPYFNSVKFSYQAGCDTGLDCALSMPECPEEASEDIVIDYTTRDYRSFRRALVDFATLRYPDWKERLEADAGMMFIELMSALGDEMAYYQDRIAREAFLESATQLRSLRRLARLVDYTVHDGLGATTWIDFEVKKDCKQQEIISGMGVWAMSRKQGKIAFEIGRGLTDILKKQPYKINEDLNSLKPYIWDEDDTCLKAGSTELHVKGDYRGRLKYDYPPVPPGNCKSDSTVKPDAKWMVLQTNPTNAALPVRRWLVKVVEIIPDPDKDEPDQNDSLEDPLPEKKTPITYIRWDASQATPFDMDMEILEVRGNIVPATAGTRLESYFRAGNFANNKDVYEVKTAIHQTVQRTGPNNTVMHLFSLQHTDTHSLVYLGKDKNKAVPEIHLQEVETTRREPANIEDNKWGWKRSFLGIHSSHSHDRHFELEDGMWNRLTAYRRRGEEIVHYDYATGEGKTIRFGDGEFGKIPAESTLFKVTYRVGNIAEDNVAEDSITHFDTNYLIGGQTSDTVIEKVNNPLPVINGEPPEKHDSIRLSAPEAYKLETYRAVLDADYAEAAERLEWVQRAGAESRWTGSWLSTFVTPDPKGSTDITEMQKGDLIDQLDVFRQAGREVITKMPKFADIDLKINICASPAHFAGEVKASVLEVLLGKEGKHENEGFFAPDNFTFGDGLNRAKLESVISSVKGVRAIICMQIRRTGWHDWRPFEENIYDIAHDEVLRLENNPMHPDRGSLKLFVEGGA